jgi:hypothetical protein
MENLKNKKRRDGETLWITKLIKKKKKLSYCLVNTIDASWIAILSAVSITTLAVNINKSSLYAEFY